VHGQFKAHPGTQGWLLKQQGDIFARQHLGPGLFFAFDGLFNQLLNFVRGEIRD
jgi:hypothetical protein